LITILFLVLRQHYLNIIMDLENYSNCFLIRYSTRILLCYFI